jgi:hypothetical protein
VGARRPAAGSPALAGYLAGGSWGLAGWCRQASEDLRLWAMPVLLAQSTRSKLKSVIAKDQSRRPDLRRMRLLNEEVSRWPAPPLHGRFWEDSDSEQDCLEGAGPLFSPSRAARNSKTSPPVGEPLHPTSTAHNSPAPRKTAPTSPLRRIWAPLKSCWKGPLPPRRITPAVFLADFVLPALDSTTPPRNPCQGSQHQPAPSRSRATPAPVGPRPSLEPRRTEDQAASQPDHPRRRRVNPSLFVSQTPYLDTVIAGARGRFRGRPGRGAPTGRTVATMGPGGGAPDPAGTSASRGGRGPADGPGGRVGGGSSCDGRPWRPWGSPSSWVRWPGCCCSGPWCSSRSGCQVATG